MRQIPKQTLKLDIHILNRLTAYYVWSEFDDAAMAAPYLYVDVTIFLNYFNILDPRYLFINKREVNVHSLLLTVSSWFQPHSLRPARSPYPAWTG